MGPCACASRMRRQRPRNSGQVVANDGNLQARLSEQGGYRVGLPLTKLDDEMPLSCQQTLCVAGNATVCGETIRAAVKRGARVIVANVSSERGDLATRNIGRVGHDEVEFTGQRATEITGNKG